jgi:hypothetical protein
MEHMPGEPRRSSAMLAAVSSIEMDLEDRRGDIDALIDPMDDQERDDLISALITVGGFLSMMTGDEKAALSRLKDRFLSSGWWSDPS